MLDVTLLALNPGKRSFGHLPGDRPVVGRQPHAYSKIHGYGQWQLPQTLVDLGVLENSWLTVYKPRQSQGFRRLKGELGKGDTVHDIPCSNYGFDSTQTVAAQSNQ